MNRILIRILWKYRFQKITKILRQGAWHRNPPPNITPITEGAPRCSAAQRSLTHPDAAGEWAGTTQKGSSQNSRLPRDLRLGGCKSSPLIEIVEERKRSAGGACPSGSWATTDNETRSIAFQETPKLWCLHRSHMARWGNGFRFGRGSRPIS